MKKKYWLVFFKPLNSYYHSTSLKKLLSYSYYYPHFTAFVFFMPLLLLHYYIPTDTTKRCTSFQATSASAHCALPGFLAGFASVCQLGRVVNYRLDIQCHPCHISFRPKYPYLLPAESFMTRTRLKRLSVPKGYAHSMLPATISILNTQSLLYQIMKWKKFSKLAKCKLFFESYETKSALQLRQWKIFEISQIKSNPEVWRKLNILRKKNIGCLLYLSFLYWIPISNIM